MVIVPKSGWPVFGQTLVNSGHTMSMVKSRPGRGFGKVSSWSADGVSVESIGSALGCGRRRADPYLDRQRGARVPHPRLAATRSGARGMRAVVLLSGGLDSATTLAVARAR